MPNAGLMLAHYWQCQPYIEPTLRHKSETYKPLKTYTVDLVIFARFYFSQISREGQIREFKNLAKIIIIEALLKKNANSRILNIVKVPKSEIRENLNTRK